MMKQTTATRSAGRALNKGSEWRKWDLHVHTPGTRLNDQYKIDGKTINHSEVDSKDFWDKFCQSIHDSDVEVIGITDYFTFNTYFAFIKEYKERYPEDQKVFFPNLELRLPNAVNSSGQHVNFHMLFPDSLTEEEAETFLRNLKLIQSSAKATKKLTVWDTRDCDKDSVKSFSVSLEACLEAAKASFDGIEDSNLYDATYLIASGKKDGISPGKDKASGAKESPKDRNAVLIDEIDLRVHGIFANSSSRDHWLRPEIRSNSDDRKFAPHPTFGGCDAHSFERLESALGKTIHEGDNQAETTWVKAKPTWDGLLQTLVEPDSRVMLQELSPDSKEDYLVIDSVEFKNTANFPQRIELNPGLNAIIGSRSSGKSSLLSHIAYAISQDGTIQAQEKCGITEPGPAAGYKWSTVENDFCQINWRNGSDEGGYLVYIPQNFLNQLSSQPEQVNEYIVPAIEKNSQKLYQSYKTNQDEIQALQTQFDSAVGEWFNHRSSVQSMAAAIEKLPDAEALSNEKEKIENQVALLSKSANLTPDELAQSKTAQDEIKTLEEKIERSKKIVSLAESLITTSNSGEPAYKSGFLRLEVNFQELAEVAYPEDLSPLNQIVSDAEKSLQIKLGSKMAVLISNNKALIKESEKQLAQLLSTHKSLFERVKSNSAIDAERKKIFQIENKQNELNKHLGQKKEAESQLSHCSETISDLISSRIDLEQQTVEDFNSQRLLVEEKLQLSLESQFTEEHLESVFKPISKRGNKDVLGEDEHVCIKDFQNDPGHFLELLASEQITLRKGFDPEMVAKSVLKLSPDFRFSAEMDGDTIGGFKQSTMTPGKQALFALTLILSDSSETWPLLIDQPEDDLDSKSIFSEIVSFLKQQKHRRQIIMVTHNANLVVGADAELVLVANRNGDDRPNEAGRTFDYLSGALEESGKDHKAPFELDRAGIREHVVDILDGGETAFIKRRQKYNL
ncbi:TrlF family AAA-like ATPase [Corynebacterium diphtheriae]|uniref:TrlF family AAA-like ATPase n=1 Tax=Corynebacterium diphtheriae TaxID=1717 RepID=UPI001FD117FF|nr:AAA family ATPase [Corynebacterium diphtheriae]